MNPGFVGIPDWFSHDNQGAAVAVADVTGNGKPDLVVLMVDNPPGQNQGLYRVGRDLDAAGAVTGGWTAWTPVPDWFSWENQGAGLAVADVTGNGKPDLVVLMVDNPPGQNQGLYRVGRDLDAAGAVAGGWTAWTPVPDWFSWENQGAGLAIADVNGNGRSDLIVLLVDDPPGQNQALYRIGSDVDQAGAVTGRWTAWTPVPDWFSWENQGAGLAVADIDGNGKPDLVVFGIDNAAGQNQAFYVIGRDIDAAGAPTAGWSSLLGVNNWFSWENQYSGVAIVQPGSPQLLVMAVDHPPGGNSGVYTLAALTEDPRTHGGWELLPYNSQVLAVHAALLRTSKVLFYAGSGNNPARAADPGFGDINKEMGTSVVWDPSQGDAAHAFVRPPTINRADGRPFDFFCGGDTFLPDGTLLSAGGNESYNNGNNLGQRDVASFDADTERWSTRAPMERGRWYPTLLALGDGRILAVSGKNDTDGQLNLQFEVYDQQHDAWSKLPPPTDPGFRGLPFYAHLFLLADGRVFFSGGRMDDPINQQAGILDLGQDPVTFVPVQANQDATARNQSSSVMLPPAQAQRVMIIGGGPPDDRTSATGSAEVVSLGQPAPRYQLAMPMSLPRMHLNAVLLPDRTVFVSGGAITHEEARVAITPRLQSEIYDPPTDTWRPGAVASIVRMYHSVALLLPDGRVVTTSGNPPPYGSRPPYLPPQPNEELAIEIYKPPYLFAGPRPTITNANAEWRYGEQVALQSPQAGNIRWVQLIRNGVTTHAFDNSQRLVDLPIRTQQGGEIVTDVPGSDTLAPPGWYMLCAVDNAGVPSVSSWIHLI